MYYKLLLEVQGGECLLSTYCTCTMYIYSIDLCTCCSYMCLLLYAINFVVGSHSIDVQYMHTCTLSISALLCTQVLLIRDWSRSEWPSPVGLCAQGCEARECAHLSLRPHQARGLWLCGQTGQKWFSGECVVDRLLFSCTWFEHSKVNAVCISSMQIMSDQGFIKRGWGVRRGISPPPFGIMLPPLRR